MLYVIFEDRPVFVKPKAFLFCVSLNVKTWILLI